MRFNVALFVAAVVRGAAAGPLLNARQSGCPARESLVIYDFRQMLIPFSATEASCKGLHDACVSHDVSF